jgi:hypothetical protein
MAKKVTVTAQLPQTVNLSVRGASNALTIQVKIEGGKKGSLTIGSGSVAWWPEYSSVNAHRVSWAKLIDLLESMPKHRTAKTLGRSS